ncbi:hypothetical protein BC941DRAFT_420470 [Chlamydoabsidia padenii]|nr:hypothetical protein BC941DRAFT_420470 [Chlamydoabsidia padenii]
MGQQDENVYPPGTIVFAKLKGYPWWPAKIEDESSVPAKVMKQKTKTKSPIWTVFFFGSRDYGFFGPDSIRPFNKVNVEKDLKAKKFKTKDLEMAVREALDPSLMEQDEEEEGEEDDGNEEQEKAPQEKKKTKVTTTGKSGKKAGRTSKATSLGSSSSTKKSKAEKGEQDVDTLSVNNNNNKRSADEDETVDKKKRRKSMSVETEDQLPNGNDRPNTSSPVTPRKSEDGLNKAHESEEFTRDFKRLYQLRHRLQKLMYEKKQGDIPLDDYPKISAALKDVEGSPMTYELLRQTKIGKVVKQGIGYEFENDTEFNIHERCQQLMRKWKELFVDSKDQVKAGDTNEGSNKDSNTILHK